MQILDYAGVERTQSKQSAFGLCGNRWSERNWPLSDGLARWKEHQEAVWDWPIVSSYYVQVVLNMRFLYRVALDLVVTSNQWTSISEWMILLTSFGSQRDTSSADVSSLPVDGRSLFSRSVFQRPEDEMSWGSACVTGSKGQVGWGWLAPLKTFFSHHCRPVGRDRDVSWRSVFWLSHFFSINYFLAAWARLHVCLSLHMK